MLAPRRTGARLDPGDAMACHAARVSKVYGRRDTAVHALRDVTLSIPSGAFTAIMGPSGSGKSTLLHCLAALDTPTSGRVFLGRTELTALTRRQQARVRRDRIGFVFQAFNLVPTLDAIENITLPQLLAGRRPDREWLHYVISQIGLQDRLKHRPSELSGGQQQRVALARALAGRPEVIFADEPTGNLDTTASQEMLTLLRDAVDQFEQTVVTVTHDPTIARYADQVLFFRDGRVVDQAHRPDVDEPPEHPRYADRSAAGPPWDPAAAPLAPGQPDGQHTMRSRRRRQNGDDTTPGRPMVGSDDEVEVARQERWLQRIREQFEAEQESAREQRQADRDQWIDEEPAARWQDEDPRTTGDPHRDDRWPAGDPRTTGDPHRDDRWPTGDPHTTDHPHRDDRWPTGDPHTTDHPYRDEPAQWTGRRQPDEPWRRESEPVHQLPAGTDAVDDGADDGWLPPERSWELTDDAIAHHHERSTTDDVDRYQTDPPPWSRPDSDPAYEDLDQTAGSSRWAPPNEQWPPSEFGRRPDRNGTTRPPRHHPGEDAADDPRSRQEQSRQYDRWRPEDSAEPVERRRNGWHREDDPERASRSGPVDPDESARNGFGQPDRNGYHVPDETHDRYADRSPQPWERNGRARPDADDPGHRDHPVTDSGADDDRADDDRADDDRATGDAADPWRTVWDANAGPDIAEVWTPAFDHSWPPFDEAGRPNGTGDRGQSDDVVANPIVDEHGAWHLDQHLPHDPQRGPHDDTGGGPAAWGPTDATPRADAPPAEVVDDGGGAPSPRHHQVPDQSPAQLPPTSDHEPAPQAEERRHPAQAPEPADPVAHRDPTPQPQWSTQDPAPQPQRPTQDPAPQPQRQPTQHHPAPQPAAPAHDDPAPQQPMAPAAHEPPATPAPRRPEPEPAAHDPASQATPRDRRGRAPVGDDVPPPLASLRSPRRPDQAADPLAALQSLQAQLDRLGGPSRRPTRPAPRRPRRPGNPNADRSERR